MMRKLVAALAVAAFGAGSAAAAGLDVALFGPLDKSDEGSGKIHYLLTNDTGRTLRVLRRQTPLDGLTSPLFEVTRNGEPVEYTGYTVEYTARGDAAYVELAPGQALSVELDLAVHYDLAAGGEYEVRYLRDARDVIAEVRQAADAGLASGWLGFDRAAATTIRVDAARAAPPAKVRGAAALPEAAQAARRSVGAMSPVPGTPLPRAGLQFSISANCPAYGPTLQIMIASGAAVEYVRAAVAELVSGRRDGYEAWFGTYDATAHAAVLAKFRATLTAMEQNNIQYDCSCADVPDGGDAVAAVKPSDPSKMLLCPQWWQLPLFGVESKAGAMVHEYTHFNIAAGTRDIVYGTANSRRLKSLHSPSAIVNADNYRLFAEYHRTSP